MRGSALADALGYSPEKTRAAAALSTADTKVTRANPRRQQQGSFICVVEATAAEIGKPFATFLARNCARRPQRRIPGEVLNRGLPLYYDGHDVVRRTTGDGGYVRQFLQRAADGLADAPTAKLPRSCFPAAGLRLPLYLRLAPVWVRDEQRHRRLRQQGGHGAAARQRRRAPGLRRGRAGLGGVLGCPDVCGGCRRRLEARQCLPPGDAGVGGRRVLPSVAAAGNSEGVAGQGRIFAALQHHRVVVRGVATLGCLRATAAGCEPLRFKPFWGCRHDV